MSSCVQLGRKTVSLDTLALSWTPSRSRKWISGISVVKDDSLWQTCWEATARGEHESAGHMSWCFIYIKIQETQDCQDIALFKYVSTYERQNMNELQHAVKDLCLKTCLCLSILSQSAAIDWLKRLCGSIQSCFGHQRYYINVILRNSLYG